MAACTARCYFPCNLCSEGREEVAVQELHIPCSFQQMPQHKHHFHKKFCFVLTYVSKEFL